MAPFFVGHFFAVSLGKFGRIRAKILRSPKNMPAPTLMVTTRHLFTSMQILVTSPLFGFALRCCQAAAKLNIKAKSLLSTVQLSV